MRNTCSRFTFAAVLSSLALSAFAQTPAPGMPHADARDARQEQRIDKGEASGTLTPRESKRLERHQQMMEKREAHMKEDGTVTPKERLRMERMDKHESRDIRREKHDRQHDINHDGKVDRPAPPAPAPVPAPAPTN